MSKWVIIVVLAFVAESALANPGPRIESDVSSALLDRYGVAVMIDSSSNNAIAASNRIYQLLVGKLQREMRDSDMLVFNGVLPETTATPGFDRSALRETIRELDNPYLDTVLLISAAVNAGETIASNIELQLTLQFIDAATGLSFATLDETSTLPLAADCRNDCVSRAVNRQVISMGRTLNAQAIVALQIDGHRDEFRMASSH